MNALLDALAALPPGEAVFDLDGTLIHRDIGEAVLRRLIARGPLPATARAVLGTDDPWAVYEGLDYHAQAVVAAQALDGLTVADCEQLVDACFADGDVAPNAPVCELAAAIARTHHRVWILTGSAEVLGKAVAPRVGVRHVFGLRLDKVGDRLTDRVIPPVTVGEGKVPAAWVQLGRRPVFAIGDSPWDAHLLRIASVARSCGRSAGIEFPAFP